MSKSTPATGAHDADVLRVDTTYGGLYAGTSFDFSAAVAEHFNAAASRAVGVLPGEFTPFAPGRHFSIACPTIPAPRPAFIEAYSRWRARIDDETEIHLAEHPHLFSTSIDDPGLIRGVPTYIPTSLVPADFFGRPHSVTLLQGDVAIFGPVERFFHSTSSGAVFDQIEDGHGRLVLEIRGDLEGLAKRGEVVLFTDPAFGRPTGVVQLGDDGSAAPVGWDPLGWDRVGDVELFLEWVATGIRPSGRSVVLELHFPNAATGLAAALYSGHTRETAFRVDATVLPA
jgi:hypothetical protein